MNENDTMLKYLPMSVTSHFTKCAVQHPRPTPAKSLINRADEMK